MFKFARSMNTLDRTIRVIIGTLLLLIGPVTDIVETDVLSDTILAVLGLTAILSGTFAYCVLYEVTGFNTRR